MKTLCVGALTAFIAACATDLGVPLSSATLGDDNEAKTARVFETIKPNHSALRIFLRDMPKGGDLHNHLSGTPYAEEFLAWAAARDFCVDPDALILRPPPCEDAGLVPANSLITQNGNLYERMVDVMSVRPLMTGKPSALNGHQQFFGAFEKFFPISAQDPGKSLASARRVADQDNVLYLELMYNPARIGSAAMVARADDWSGDFEREFAEMAASLPDLVAQAQSDASRVEAVARDALGCEEDARRDGCTTVVRYNCFGLRLIPEAALFTQLAQCFALIEADPRFFGVSLVQPEDHPIAVKYYERHMQMIAFFKEQFPSARVTLHAGELTLGLVPPAALRDHIAKAIYVAGSDRIGHGVDIAFEDDSRATLSHMADQGIAVEVNLSSNAVILGIEGAEHPLSLYRASGVPTVLSTDDLGVLRSDMTQQYLMAARDHGLSYLDLKQLSRNSLHYAFLPGESLWEDATYTAYRPDCAEPERARCRDFLDTNPKAALQRQLEQHFIQFEADFSDWSIAP
jgi:adenosine deaminase